MSSLIRRLPFAGALFRARSCRRADAPSAPRPAAPPAADARLDELRGEAMRRLFPKLYTWWSSRWEWGVALQVYAYLAEATTIEELENRVRHVERQRHFHH